MLRIFEKRKHVGLILLLLSLLIGSFFRLYKCDEVPGFEHDEALVCLGAQLKSDYGLLSLTGDKVYEGPLLEYLIGINFLLFGSTLQVARIFMGIIGVGAIIAIYLLGSKISGSFAGGSAALSASLFPVSIIASRVIYACNLTYIFLPISLYFVFSYLDSSQRSKLFWAAVFLGMAGHARLTNLVLIIPLGFIILVIESRKKHKFIMLLVLGLVISVIISPLIIYNYLHDWPIKKVFIDPVQSHSLMSYSNPFRIYFKRFAAYTKTLKNSITGNKVWIDFPDLEFKGGKVIFVFVLVSFLNLIRNVVQTSSRELKILLILFGFLYLTVPAITKTISPEKFEYHPHYLDVFLPFVFLIIGIFFSDLLEWFEKLKIFSPSLIVLSLMAIFISLNVLNITNGYRKFEHVGGPGRWRNTFQKAAEIIVNKYSRDNYKIVMNYQFGKGYPQLKFLLNGFEVIPFVGKFDGIYNDIGQLNYAKILSVSKNREKEFWKIEDKVPNSQCYIWSAITPGIFVDGYMKDQNEMRCYIKLRGMMSDESKWQTKEGQLILGTKKIDINILHRQDNRLILEGFRRVVSNVTLRHYEELKHLSRTLSGINIVCRSKEGVIGLRWTRIGNQWLLKMNFEDKYLEGVWRGTLKYI